MISPHSEKVYMMVAEAFNLWLHIPQEKLDMIMDVIFELHASSLLLNNSQDSSVLQCGRPAAQVIFGEPRAINAASYLIIDWMKRVKKRFRPEAWRLYVEQLLRIHRAQGWDNEWRDNIIYPSVDDYLNMIDDETGAPSELLIRLMHLEANAGTSVDYIPLVKLIGRYLHIQYDYHNLTSNMQAFCEDFDECKTSLPMIYNLESSKLMRKILLENGRGTKLKNETKSSCLWKWKLVGH
ncbi:isoprenoid synthase domain-containing protein [Xylariales sp. PMI_506]|nr:isoprenoid synthase domain-containing protein [Xylariales sp. PMI_506]